MQRIPLTAHAECADGPCGELSGLCVRADSRVLEYYVVADTTPGHPIERLVARTRVDPSAISTVKLDCTREELAKMQPLNVQEMQQLKAGSSQSGVVDSERAPDGTGVLRQNQVVEAKNGKVGKLIGVVADEAGQLTHFYTRLDKHGSSELFLPVSAVFYVDRTTVFLKLDKQQLESLPAVPALTDKPGELEAHKHMELFARVYESPGGASEALKQLEQAQKDAQHPIKLREAAVLVRQGDAPPRIEGKGESGTGKGIAKGVAAGGLLAMLGPIGLVAGAVGGGAIGGVVGSRVDLGFPDTFLKGLQEKLKPDHSALIVLVEHDRDQDPAEVRGILEGAMSQSALVDTLVQDMLATEEPAVAAGHN
jgi:uncharacterized membrane protein